MTPRTMVLAPALLVCLGLASAARGQERSFTLTVDLLGATPIAERDTWETLRVFHYNEAIDQNAAVQPYGTRYDSIDDNPGLFAAPRIGLRWREGDDAFDVSARWYGRGHDSSGLITSPAPAGSADQAVINGPCIPGVPFHCLVPTENDAKPLGLSDVPWRTSADLQLWSATATWQGDAGARVGLKYGLRVGGSRDETSYRIDMDALVRNYQNSANTFVNHTTISATQRARFLGVGPYLAVAGRHEPSPWGLEWEAGAGVLVGRADVTGFWHDEDTIDVSNPQGAVVQHQYLNGEFPFEERTTRAVPVADLRVAATRGLGGATVGRVGIDVSTLFDVPVAPLWSVPGAWTALDASSWMQRSRTIVLASFFVGAAFDL